MTHTHEKWHAANMANDHQGVVIEDITGRNVALVFDRNDTALLAAAPALYEALKLCERALECRDTEAEEHAAKEARRVIRLAEGGKP